MLLSILVKFKAQGIDFNGDFPEDLAARKILETSGFLKNLLKTFKEEDTYEIGRENSIHTHALKYVDAQLGHKLIEQASITVWEEKRRCQGVQRTLLELMLNTNNHADTMRQGEKHWWLSVNHRKKEKIVSFSFVDFGVGIFNSLNNKKEGSKFFGWAEKLEKKFTYGNNADILSLILKGELHKTVTGKHYRGHGLPGINDVLKRNQISKLHIITNNVYADVESGNFRTLPKDFDGTFIYWELNIENESCYGIN